MKKKRIIFINCYADSGSTASIMNCIEDALKDEYDFYYFYQIGSPSHDNYYLAAPWWMTKIYYGLARVVGIKYGLGLLPTIKIVRQIRKLNPDIIHVHCPNFYNINLYYLFGELKRNKLPIIVTNHAEFFYTGNCAYAFECEKYLTGCHHCTRVFDIYHKYLINQTELEWKLMKKAFAQSNIIHTVVSPWAYNRIKNAPITEKCEVHLIENSVDCNAFKVKKVNRNSKRKIILNVTALFSDKKDDNKGGYYVLEIAKRMPQYDFWIAGNNLISKTTEVSKNVFFWGHISEKKELADCYNMADLTLLTSKKETFGMVCAESLCCGTPVVGFEAGGTESIAIEKYSSFVPYGDVEGLQIAIENFLDMKEQCDLISQMAHEKYSPSRMTDNYKKLYESVLCE